MRPLRVHVGAAAVAFALLDGFANELDGGAFCRTAPKEQALHSAHHIFVFNTDGDLFAVFSFFRAEGTVTEFFERVRHKDLAKRGRVIECARTDLGNAKLHFYGVKAAAVLKSTVLNDLHVGRNIQLAQGKTACKRAVRNFCDKIILFIN